MSVIFTNSLIASDSRIFNVRYAIAPQGKIELYSHESVLFGLSCKSGKVNTINDIRNIKIGDTIRSGEHSFKVGVIEVTQYLTDVTWGGKTQARAGEVHCIAARDKSMFPYDDDCNALWVLIKPCLVPLQ